MMFPPSRSVKLCDLRDESHQDAVIRTSHGSSFRCHKVVLSLACPLLANIFPHQSDPQVIILDGFSDNDVEEFLDSIYLVKQPQKNQHLLNYLLNDFDDSKIEPKVESNFEHEVIFKEHIEKESNDMEFTILENSNYKELILTENNKKEIISDSNFDSKTQVDFNESNEPMKIMDDQRHWKNIPVTCPYCDKKRTNIDRHVVMKHPSKADEYKMTLYLEMNPNRKIQGSCEICNLKLGTKHEYNKHLKSHINEISPSSNIFCEKCGKGPFMTESILNVHIETHKKDIECSEDGCNKVFSRGSELREHALIDHKTILTRKRQRNNKDQICVHCGAGFGTEGYLKVHINDKHEGATSKHKCNICGQKFPYHSALTKHSVLHAEPTIPCPECEKLFRTNWKLTMHIRNHHLPDDKKIFQCSECPKGFNASKSLESHINIHLGLKPFLCLFCDVGFADKSNLGNHVRRLHPDGVESVK